MGNLCSGSNAKKKKKKKKEKEKESRVDCYWKFTGGDGDGDGDGNGNGNDDEWWPGSEGELREEYERWFRKKAVVDDGEVDGIGSLEAGKEKRKKQQQKKKKKNKAEVHCEYMISTIADLLDEKTKRNGDDGTFRILDVGCGSGEITVDVAEMFPEAKVVGLDVSAAMLESAKVFAERRGVKNVEFVKGNVFDLGSLFLKQQQQQQQKKRDGDEGDAENKKNRTRGKFDVVYTHQVVAHLGDSVLGIRKMVEVVKSGGVVCLREGDLASGRFWPEGEYEELQECFRTIVKVHEGDGGTADAGRRLKSWLESAGFGESEIVASRSISSYDTPAGRREYGGHWPARCMQGLFADRAMAMGVSAETLEKWAMAWKDWIEDEDGGFAMMHGEVIAIVA